MRALDLFCCSGGMSMGFHLAGFDVVGVDISAEMAKYYPFDFIEHDCLTLDMDFLQSFDLISASPPCQHYSVSTATWRAKGKEYPDLIEPTRELLKSTGVPYIIENVEAAGKHLHNPVKLCGTMFPDLKVFRHRVFECSFPVDMSNMKCDHTGHKINAKLGDGGDFFTCAGKSLGTMPQWQDAMGIDWIHTRHQLAQAIPPDYSYFLAKEFLNTTQE